jgi:hypothetical protein
MNWNRHFWTTALELSDLDGGVPPGYRSADGEIFAPGKYGTRQKGWGEAERGGVVVSLLGSDDGAWFRDIAKRKDDNAVATEAQLPKTD